MNISLSPTPVAARNTRLKCLGLKSTNFAMQSSVMLLPTFASMNSITLDISFLPSRIFPGGWDSAKDLCKSTNVWIAQELQIQV